MLLVRNREGVCWIDRDDVLLDSTERVSRKKSRRCVVRVCHYHRIVDREADIG